MKTVKDEKWVFNADINEEKAGFVAFQALTFRCFVCPKPVQQLGTQEMILTDCLISANEESNPCGPGRT